MPRQLSFVDWERWALETFFLAPGAEGPVECVEVTDEHVAEFAGTTDVGQAARAFASGLGAASATRDLLSGSVKPPRNGDPRYVRILVFACWIQVTSMRHDDEREFKDLLSQFLGWSAPSHLSGLQPMWEYLRKWLWDEHRVDLRLPPTQSYVRIGSTVRLPFPTWRDVRYLRKVRDDLPKKSMDSRRLVADRIGLGEYASRPSAFAPMFEEWRRAVRIGDPGVAGLAFDRAWTRVISEKIEAADLVIVEDDFGELRLKVSPRSRSAAEDLAFTMDSEELVAPSVRRALLRGEVAFSAEGFGRWIATSDLDMAGAFLRKPDEKSPAGARTSDDERRVEPLGWLLRAHPATRRAHQRVEATTAMEVRRTDGIRVASALLGRWPMTPKWFVSGTTDPALTVAGVDVAPARTEQTLRLPAGIWTGTVLLRSGERFLDGFQLVPNALEHQSEALRGFDAGTTIAEDGALYGTVPEAGIVRTARYVGPRADQDARMAALSEAVYARAAFGLSMGEFASLAGRAVEDDEAAPSPWDLMRSFVDGGWLEPGAVRAASARTFSPRPPRLRRVSVHRRRLLVLDGMAALAMRGRVADVAASLGIDTAEEMGIGPWSLPLLLIHAADRDSEVALAARTGLAISAGEEDPSPCSKHWRVPTATTGFDAATLWMREGGRSDRRPSVRDAFVLMRRDRSKMDQPPIYIVGRSKVEEVFRSPVLALLRYHERSGGRPFVADGRRLLRSSSRVFLPAAWGRWLSLRSLACAGPVHAGTGWTYAYPADHAAVHVLSDLCAVFQSRRLPIWAERLRGSARADAPSIVVAGASSMNLRSPRVVSR